MKHAIACKLDGQHGVLIHAPRLHVAPVDIPPKIYRDGREVRLTGLMPAIAVMSLPYDCTRSTVTVLSRS